MRFICLQGPAGDPRPDERCHEDGARVECVPREHLELVKLVVPTRIWSIRALFNGPSANVTSRSNFPIAYLSLRTERGDGRAAQENGVFDVGVFKNAMGEIISAPGVVCL